MSLEELQAIGLYELKAIISQIRAVAKAAFTYAWNDKGNDGTNDQLFCAIETLSNQAYDIADSLDTKLSSYVPVEKKDHI